MEYFQRLGLKEPQWTKKMTKDALHKFGPYPSLPLLLTQIRSFPRTLVSCTYQDPLNSLKEAEIHADRFFHTMKEAEHNTAILVLLQLIPAASSAKDIQDYMVLYPLCLFCDNLRWILIEAP